MPRLVALAVSIGVLAVVATWVFFLPDVANYKLQVWQGFIAWGCYYMSGAKAGGGAVKTTICMIFGAVVGMAAGLLAGELGALGQLAAPVAVGLGATVIVLASSLSFLATIPASVYGFASIAGLFLLSADTSPTDALLPTALSIVLGVIFGVVSELVADALTKKTA